VDHYFLQNPNDEKVQVCKLFNELIRRKEFKQDSALMNEMIKKIIIILNRFVPHRVFHIYSHSFVTTARLLLFP